ncbi:nucleotide-binding protein [Streptomyces sp. NPDC002851]
MAGADWQRDVLRELKQAEAEAEANNAEPGPGATDSPADGGNDRTMTLQLSRAEAERAWREQAQEQQAQEQERERAAQAAQAAAAQQAQHIGHAGQSGQAGGAGYAAQAGHAGHAAHTGQAGQFGQHVPNQPASAHAPQSQQPQHPHQPPQNQQPQPQPTAQPPHAQPTMHLTQQPLPPAEPTGLAPAASASPAAPGPRTPAVTPESEPTLDPRLSGAVGRPVRGDSAVRRTGRSLRKLTSSAAKEVEELTRLGREVQQPVTTGRVIAVSSIRGGVGKTTVSALLARTFNHYRQDPVLALEMDPALGTLPVRLGAETVRWSVADLAQLLNPSMLLTDVTGYLVPVTDGGWLLPASQGRIGAMVDVEMYRTVTLALRRYFGVSVVDCECLPGEVARTAMATAHARVVVAPVTAEGVNGTRRVLDWLAGLPRGVLATTVVALTASSPDTSLDVKKATAHLREAGVAVVPFPYDRHLGAGGTIQNALLGEDTRRAAARLAAEALQFAVRKQP